jgi:hypothetical protein
MQTNVFSSDASRHKTSSYQKRKEDEGWILASEAPYSTDNECLKDSVTIDEFVEAVSNHIYEYYIVCPHPDNN